MATAARRTSGEMDGMAERNLPLGGENTDDLPRTLRREREAREREARDREMRAQSSFGAPEPAPSYTPPASTTFLDDPQPATVRRFDVPFLHLVTFFLKATVAAIPALILLAAIVIGGTHAAKFVFPNIEVLQVRLILSDPPPARPAAQPAAAQPAAQKK